MHFYIGPVIVKFQNGQFGIRRWRLFGCQFLGMSGDYWWTSKEYIGTHCTGTEPQVRARFDLYLSTKNQAPAVPEPGYDKGTPVTTP
jgi:hypothetical protein